MVRVYPGDARIQVRHFGWYDQPIGGREQIIVRRKIGEPCDTLHPSNKALQLQRRRLTKASKDWAKLSRLQKHWWNKQIGWSHDMKLLSGQQLYTSKHIHNQFLYSDIDDPSPVTPRTPLAPCLTAASLGGIILDATTIGIYQDDPILWFHPSKKVGLGSFLYDDFPEQINDGRVVVSPTIGFGTMLTHINSWENLVLLHFAQVYEQLLLSLYHDFMHTFITEADFHPDSPGVAYVGDIYSGSFPSPLGSYGATISVGFWEDYTTSHILDNYFCPVSTIMEVRKKIPGLPVLFIVHRDENGDYFAWQP